MLKAVFSRKFLRIEMADKNKQRFESIISDKRFNFLEPIYTQLYASDTNLTDEEILDSYYKFSDHIQTNTFAAAELEWVTISVLCFYRPHLTGELIKRGLLAIVYSIGEKINASDIFEFIHQRILADNLEPYGGLPPENGMNWLTEIQTTQNVLVQRVLEEVIRQNKLELENP